MLFCKKNLSGTFFKNFFPISITKYLVLQHLGIIQNMDQMCLVLLILQNKKF